jgi:hypothetical protein
VLAKSIDFSWKSTRQILLLSRATYRAQDESGEYLDRFRKLKPETARSAIQFYRLRERAAKTHLK